MKEGDRKRGLSRRQFLTDSRDVLFVTLGIAIFGGCRFPDFEIGLYQEGKPFGNKDANIAAEQLGISTGSFFKLDLATVDSLAAFTGERLFPIYPPSVLAYKKLIYNLSQEFKVPPNIVATLMTIESAGGQFVGSQEGGIGLFRPLEDKFPQRIRDIKEPSKRVEALIDPQNNGEAGLNYLATFCLPAARESLPDLSPDHSLVWVKTMIAYSAGTSVTSVPFEELPDESKIYAHHTLRFYLTAEVANLLRIKKYPDVEIIQALSSREIDARAFALSNWDERKRRGGGGLYTYSYQEYLEVLDVLGDAGLVRSPDSQVSDTDYLQLVADRNSYLKDPSFKVPASPGLRIWLALGGSSLFLGVPDNTRLAAWRKIST